MFLDLITKIFVPLKSSVPLLVYMFRSGQDMNPLMQIMSLIDQQNQFASNHRSIWGLVYKKQSELLPQV